MPDETTKESVFVADLRGVTLTPELKRKLARDIQTAALRVLAETDFEGDVSMRVKLLDSEVPFPGHTVGFRVIDP